MYEPSFIPSAEEDEESSSLLINATKQRESKHPRKNNNNNDGFFMQSRRNELSYQNYEVDNTSNNRFNFGQTMIGVLGTGDFARAITKRLILSGYDVLLGSRFPHERNLKTIDEIFDDAKIVSYDECLTNPQIKIFILAVNYAHYSSILKNYEDFLKGKILVDVSNRDTSNKAESNAENLANMFPHCHVVKAFNTLSAYAIESDIFGGSRRVLIASNSSLGHVVISDLSRDIGFSPVTVGGLRNARKLETYQLTLMTGWGSPTAFTIGVFFIWFAACAVEFGMFFGTHPQFKAPYSGLPLGGLNKPICLTAITLLALSYLPGCFAAILQICYGTKYKRFPNWMDRWMKSRKMLGLYALFFSCWHVLISAIYLSPASMPEWYQTTKIYLPDNTTGFSFQVSSEMNWIGETTITVGVLALMLMSLIGLSSLPSVGEILNWQEWRFFQSRLGHLTLLLVVGHVLIMSVPMWIKFPKLFIISNNFYCLFLPALVFFLKLILLIPCIDKYVTKIRSGWERRKSYRVVSNGYMQI